MDYGLIKKAAKEKKMSIGMLAEAIGMTEQGLYKAMKNDTLTIKMLEKIGETLQVNLNYFLDTSAVSEAEITYNTGNKRLEEELQEAKQIIYELNLELLRLKMGKK